MTSHFLKNDTCESNIAEIVELVSRTESSLLNANWYIF